MILKVITVYPWTVSAETILFWKLECGKYSREETIQGRKLLFYFTFCIHTYLLKDKKINRYCFISCKLDQANWFLSAATSVLCKIGDATTKWCSRKGSFIIIFATIIQGRKLIKVGNYQLLRGFYCGNYLREETIQGRKLFAEIRYVGKCLTKRKFLLFSEGTTKSK